ncbi:MAG: DNA-formamidopyrimidine glycosylase [Syntrophobacteraceae bacterium CG2_30_61_12]|nr:MAG: DNA-formamidopyrimidine glycosylase [Syntrophobacteraceae bacterium CG2_30_61_12]
MPELPEVETLRRCLEPYLVGRRIESTRVRNPKLRWPVPIELPARLQGRVIQGLERRGKYLLMHLADGAVILHLGMSGCLLVRPEGAPAATHDHLEIVLDSGKVLCLNDPRRFGCVLWCPGDPLEHPLLAGLGPEPFAPAFTGDYLYQRARGRKATVKAFIMDSRIVTGVGNIYANEALFAAAIDPRRAAGRISRKRYHALAAALVEVLRQAIQQGGTTLRDFRDAVGNPGWFQLQLKVYGRAGEPCPRCLRPLSEVRLAQRATTFCAACQR